MSTSACKGMYESWGSGLACMMYAIWRDGAIHHTPHTIQHTSCTKHHTSYTKHHASCTKYRTLYPRTPTPQPPNPEPKTQIRKFIHRYTQHCTSTAKAFAPRNRVSNSARMNLGPSARRRPDRDGISGWRSDARGPSKTLPYTAAPWTSGHGEGGAATA